MKFKDNKYALDLDFLEQDYISSYLKNNVASNGVEEAELINKLHNQWKDLPNEHLNGMTPKQLIDSIPEDELFDFFLACCEGDNYPSDLLFERLVKKPETTDEIYRLLLSQKDTGTLFKLLYSLDYLGNYNIELLLKVSEREDICNDVRESIADSLAEAISLIGAKPDAKSLKDIELVIQKATLAQKNGDYQTFGYLCDALSHSAYKTDSIFDLLCTYFKTTDELAFGSQMLATYGDERAAAILYPALDDCRYIDFIEVRNAIEQLGGTVGVHRDFSNDESYLMLKRIESKLDKKD